MANGTALKTQEARDKEQQQLMAEIIERMVNLDFIRLAILAVNLSEHQFNILQHNEILRLSEAKKLESQPLDQKEV